MCYTIAMTIEKVELPVTVWPNHNTDDASGSHDQVLRLMVDDGLLFIERSDDELEPYVEVPVADLLEAIKQAQEK